MSLIDIFWSRQELRQHAALPYRVDEAGKLRVCLVTSRGTGRWIIPKGWPKPALAPHELAAREALEEAGLEGEISDTSIGTFTYVKRLHTFSRARCIVDVFPLRVTRQRPDWPEREARETAWFSPKEAARLVQEPDLATLIREFAASD